MDHWFRDGYFRKKIVHRTVKKKFRESIGFPLFLHCLLIGQGLILPFYLVSWLTPSQTNLAWFLLVRSTCLLITLWEKGKLSVTSNFSFSHSVYYRFGELSATFIKFNPFPNKPWFLRVCNASFLKTLWEKEKLLVTSNFSFSHCFLPF